MSATIAPATLYPDSDGRPLADNTRQFEEITMLKLGLDALFMDREDVFVAGDLLWYPVEGHPEIRQAPDVLVAQGRPKGHRGSYKQWAEAGIAPQVVFEILSPGNRLGEMLRKYDFYERYGVEEYYVYDPDTFEFTAAWRQEGALATQEPSESCISPLLGIRFALNERAPWAIWRPDGERFLTYLELVAQRNEERERARTAEARAAQAEAERDRLRARLQERESAGDATEA